MDPSQLSLVEMDSKHKLNVRRSICSASDTTIFFIHGSMGSLTQYSALIAAYDGIANIVAYDVIGCGGSEKPTNHSDYSTQSLTSNAIQIFDMYATKKNILVGHSYGTAQIARLCTHVNEQQSNKPDDVPTATISGVVLLGTVDSLPKGGCSAFSIFSLPLCVLNPMQNWMSKSYVNMAYSAKSDPDLKAAALLTAGKNKMYVCKAFYQQFEWAVEVHWKAVSRYPVLICQGEDDQVTPLEGARTLVNLLLKHAGLKGDVTTALPSPSDSEKAEGSPSAVGSELDDQNGTGKGSSSRIRLSVIGGAGHQMQEERPKEISALMDAFFLDDCGLSLAARVTVQ